MEISITFCVESLNFVQATPVDHFFFWFMGTLLSREMHTIHDVSWSWSFRLFGKVACEYWCNSGPFIDIPKSYRIWKNFENIFFFIGVTSIYTFKRNLWKYTVVARRCHEIARFAMVSQIEGIRPRSLVGWGHETARPCAVSALDRDREFKLARLIHYSLAIN